MTPTDDDDGGAARTPPQSNPAWASSVNGILVTDVVSVLVVVGVVAWILCRLQYVHVNDSTSL